MKKAQLTPNKLNRKYVRDFVKVDCLCTAFETNYNEDFYFGGEFHPFWEFVYVISGSVGVSGDDRIYYLNERDIIFHKPMEFHRLWGVNDKKPKLLIMSFEISGQMCSLLENGVFSLNDAQNEKIIELLEFLRKNTTFITKNTMITHFLNNWEDPCISQGVASRMESFFLTLATNFYTKREDIREEIKKNKQITSVLIENIDKWLSLDEIASMCNMSKSQLKRVFSATSAIGIHNYFIKLKIAESMKLLLSGMSVAEASEALGFSSPNYFNNVFKRETGVTPLSYKKNMF